MKGDKLVTNAISPYWPIFALIYEKYQLTWYFKCNWFPDMYESEVTSANPNRQQWRKEMSKKEGVWRGAGCWRVTPVCTYPELYIGHILPCQIGLIFLVKLWCCMAVDAGQMDRHMAWALSFRCSVCWVTLHKGQMHTFRTFTGPYWNLHLLLPCGIWSASSIYCSLLVSKRVCSVVMKVTYNCLQ